MKPLILTGWPIDEFEETNLGDLQAVFCFHFAWGKLPSPAKLAAYLGPRTHDGGPRRGDHKEDFSRHNPIDRWWGGTRLTNDRLWRWDPVLIAP